MKLNIKSNSNIHFTKNNFLNSYLNNFIDNENTYELIKYPCFEHDPRLLNDAQSAAEYILKTDKKIFICGDYDCDGIMATSILFNTIKQFNSNVNFMIPDRIIDGYGLNIRMIDVIKTQVPPNEVLILTCDNGIACFEAIDYAKSLGMTVIVTDHHTVGEKLPNADFIVHPALGNYPFKEISGATVAYKLCKLIIEMGGLNIPNLEISNKQFAAITVVSDVMPICSYYYDTMKVNENRRLLQEGITSMRNNPDWHIKMLSEMCNFNMETLDETTIGFNIAPVLNASGRIAKADYAVDFFTKEQKDRDAAIVDCSYLVYLNEERKKMKIAELNKAESVVCGKSIKLAFYPELHKGLIGIVAGQFVDKYKVPSGIFTQVKKDGTVLWTGSMRSNTVHLYNALTEISKKCPIVAFGGHAGAAGITIADENIDLFKQIAEKYFYTNACEPTNYAIEVKDYRSVLDAGECIKELKPFGNGLPKPQVKFNFFCTTVDVFYKSGHVKLSNFKQEELWLFGKRDEIKKHPVLSILPLKSDNMQKLQETMNKQEAEKNKWERYSQYKKYYNFIIEAEIDYSYFNNQLRTQISVKKFK